LTSQATTTSPPRTQLRALLVEFESPGALVTAAERVRDAGYRHWDTHSPFPVHGIDEAMGIRPTRLPWLVFLLGLAGCGGGLALQWWTNATSAKQFPFLDSILQGYDYLISGKPIFSLPANIPVTFETTVLAAAIAAVIGMLAMNNLPMWANPLFASQRFRRATSDRFFLTIQARDPKFDADKTYAFLSGLGGIAVERIEEDSAAAKLPPAFKIAGIVLAALALLPPLLIAKARLSTSTEPRIQPVQDMGNQPKYLLQQRNPVFADGRAQRPLVPGTLARGDLQEDPFFYQGQINGQWATTFPPQIQINDTLLRRGQQRFNIYCSVCHGLGGAGDGIVSAHAMNLETPGWVQPTSLHDPLVKGRENGHIFNTITKGIRSMPPYGDQIPPADRWAIIAYVRSLQLARDARLEDIPVEERANLRPR